MIENLTKCRFHISQIAENDVSESVRGCAVHYYLKSYSLYQKCLLTKEVNYVLDVSPVMPWDCRQSQMQKYSRKPITFHLIYLSGMEFFMDTNFPSYVTVQRYAMNGSVCNENWRDTDASVLCREKGYGGGIAVGFDYSNLPFFKASLVTNVNCKGDESRVKDCGFSDVTNISPCGGTENMARVVCYRSYKGQHSISYILKYASYRLSSTWSPTLIRSGPHDIKYRFNLYF